MSEPRTNPDEPRYSEDGQSFEIRSVVRRFGAIHVLGGLLGFVGPAGWGNDDDFVNVEPGLFLGQIAVNGPHALLHVLFGVLGVQASRDAESKAEAAGVHYERTILEGVPHEAIVEYSVDSGADPVVMGASGRSRLKEHLLGIRRIESVGHSTHRYRSSDRRST